jgi:hypothetical protein
MTEHLELLISGIEPPAVDEAFKEMLAAKISQLINNDFAALVQLLYRIDISEKKLKQVIGTQPAEDAAKLIAAMIIERQLEKARLRKQYRDDKDINEEERW